MTARRKGAEAADAGRAAQPDPAANLAAAVANTRAGEGSSKQPGRVAIVVPPPRQPAAKDGGRLAGPQPLHPGLDRIKSVARRKAAFRGGARTGDGFDELAATMDVLDQRIGGSLRDLRAQNSVGLGAVRGLSYTKSGRMRLDGSKRAVSPVCGDGEVYSPAGVLGREAVEHPERFLQRIKFDANQASTDAEGNGGRSSPTPPGNIIPAVHGAQQACSSGAAPEPPSTDQLDRLVGAPTSLQGPRWGATEGGLDRLGWVRNLVQFSTWRQQQEQLPQPDQQQQDEGGGDSKEDPTAMDTITWLEGGAGLRPQTGAGRARGGPGARPLAAAADPQRTVLHSREEVALLQAWLQDMMSQVIAQTAQGQQAAAAPAPAARADAAPGRPLSSCAVAGTGGPASLGAVPASSGERSAADMADAALWVYGMAFEELLRQVRTECGDRGALLGGMWQHTFSLVELRCSLVYEGIVGAIREELQAVRQQNTALLARAQAAEQQVQENARVVSAHAAMESEMKRMAQLLATAEEDYGKQLEELDMLRRAVDTQSALRSAAEGRLAEEQQQRLSLQQEREQLVAASEQQERVVARQGAELEQLRSDLARVQAERLVLGDDKARLEVGARKAQRDFQTAEILAMSLREQLQAREAELAELSSQHTQLQQEQAAASMQLLECQAQRTGLQLKHDSLQASSADQRQQLEQALEAERAELAGSRSQLAAAQAARQELDQRLQETLAREAAVTAQLKQLAGVHDQQAAKLRQEVNVRRNCEDELQAIRAGLQVTQQRLEGLGLVFASPTTHRTAAEAWKAIGPISIARQVVATVNQQLGELAARRAELQHEVAAAKERWQAEEGVRIRLQEQLLEVKAQLSKVLKEREGVEGVLSRMESQRATLDAELAHMRKMLADSESRCQASHKKAMEAANEAKRLSPLEAKVAHLEAAVHTAGVELERVQHEVTAHQSSIRKLLDEKSTALEQLAARSQALDAAQLQIRELSAASRDRLQLAEDKAKLEEELHSLRQRCGATERLQGESMHQLAVARRLLADAHSADERSRLAATQQELQRSRVAEAALRREGLLLKDRLAAAEGQLQFMERQLQAAVHKPLAAAVAAASSSGCETGAGGRAMLPGVVEQMKRLLETKEERIKQLERLQSSVASSASQLRQLQGDLAARDAEVGKLREEVASTRQRLHLLQDTQAMAATKDLVALAAADPGLPPAIAQALALDYARNHLRSELVWTRAKLAFVCNLARGLRTQLQQAKLGKDQAEMESVIVEAFYLQQGLLEQRAFAAAFDATFLQVKRVLTSAIQALADMRRQLATPALADLPCIAQQVDALAAALGGWVDRFCSHVDQSCQADPLAELEAWQNSILAALPAARPTSPPPLQHVSAIIVQVYAHRLRQLPLQGPSEPGALADNVYEAMADFFCERRGFNRQAALSPTGPVAALLAGARNHLQQPKAMLLGRLVGMVPSGSTGSSRMLQHPAAWRFFQQLLCCLRALLGASWEPLVKEWVDSEGVLLPLQCVMDVLANLYNTDAPALLDCMRQGLVPLVRQGRRGPAVDLDAFLLVMMQDYSDGSCPINPLAVPRRLTDGCLAAATAGSGAAPGLAGGMPGMALTATAAGGRAGVGGAAADPYLGAAGDARQQQQQQQRQQQSPMRRRIVNLTAAADAWSEAPASPLQMRSAKMGPEPTATGSQKEHAGSGGTKSLQVLTGMHSLLSSNPALPVGLRSQLRASAPSSP